MDEETKRLVTPPEHPRWSFKQRAVYWSVFLVGMALLSWGAHVGVNFIFDILWPQ